MMHSVFPVHAYCVGVECARVFDCLRVHVCLCACLFASVSVHRKYMPIWGFGIGIQ